MGKNTMGKTTSGVIALILAGTLVPALANAQDAGSSAAKANAAAQDGGPKPEFSSGVTWLDGKYGQPIGTSVLYAPFTAAYRSSTWKFDATLPYLDVRGPGNVVGAGGTPTVVGSGSSKVTDRAGLGDLTFGGSAMLPKAPALPFLEFAARVKVPTAQHNLGTGQTDVAAQMNAYQIVTPRLTLLASAGYQWLGKSATYRLKDGALAMVGADYKAARDLDLGISANYISSIAHGLQDQVSVTPFLAWRADRHWGVTAYGLAGATRSSPDYGAGFQLTFYPF
jgi:hypothetical protein